MPMRPLVMALLVAPLLCACAPKNTLPPLLQNLEAHGGWADACPVSPDMQASVKRLGLADTPELDRRLSAAFPTGTAEHVLTTKLYSIGFQSIGHCKDDQSIHIARFDEASQTDGFLIFPMTATVFWKVDKDNKVLWSKGFVFYTGP